MNKCNRCRKEKYIELFSENNKLYKICIDCRILHRPERKMRQNAVMTYIFYNYVSSSLLNVPL